LISCLEGGWHYKKDTENDGKPEKDGIFEHGGDIIRIYMASTVKPNDIILPPSYQVRSRLVRSWGGRVIGSSGVKGLFRKESAPATAGLKKESIGIPMHQLNDEDAADQVNSWYTWSQGRKRQDNARAERYRNIFLCKDPPPSEFNVSTGDPDEDKRLYSDTYLPMVSAMVEAATAQLLGILFSRPDYMQAVAEHPVDFFSQELISEHMRRRHRQMDFKNTIAEAVQTALQYDYAVTRCYWKIAPGEKKSRKTETNVVELGPLSVNRRETFMDRNPAMVIDRPDVEVLDYFLTYPDYDARRGFDDSEFFCDVYYPSLTLLKALDRSRNPNMGFFYNIDKVVRQHLKSQGVKDPTPGQIEAWPLNEQDDPAERSFTKSGTRVKVIRCYTPYEVVETCYGIPIRRHRIEGYPYQLWKTVVRTQEFPGMGMIERLERPQYDVNLILNLKRDFQNFIMNPISILDESIWPMGEEGDIHLYPGRTFKNDSGRPAEEMISVVKPGFDVGSQANEEIGLQMSLAERIGTGLNPQGAFARGKKTATEVSEVSTGSSNKALRITERWEDVCLEKIFTTQFYLEQVNMTTPQVLSLHGTKGYEYFQVAKEDYFWLGEPRMEMRGTSYLAEDAIAEQKFFTGINFALAAPQLHNVPNIFKRMWQILEPRQWSEFLRGQGEAGHDVPPGIENFIMARGHPPEISPMNDDVEHLRSHEKVSQSIDFQLWPRSYQNNMTQHVFDHRQQMNQKQPPRPIDGELVSQQDGSDTQRGIRGLAQR
jgi:hypothetical protein